MVLKKGSLMTSGHTAGQGLPHIRLKDKKIICWSRMERCVNTLSDTDFLHNNHNDCWQHPENRLGMFKFAFTEAYFHTSFTYTNIIREDGKMRSTMRQSILFPLLQQRKICSNCLRTINHHLHTSSNKGSHDKTSEACYSKHIVWLQGIMVDRVNQWGKMSNAFCFRFR